MLINVSVVFIFLQIFMIISIPIGVSAHAGLSNTDASRRSMSVTEGEELLVEGVENRMKALDRSGLDELYRVNPMEAFAGVIKEVRS